MRKIYYALLTFILAVTNCYANQNPLELDTPVRGKHTLTYSYGYDTHTCYGNFYNPESSNGNPACDTYALDFFPSEGTTKRVYSVENGTVLFSGIQNNYGNTVIVNHGNGVLSRYAHLSWITSPTVKGAKIRKGAMLGVIGNSVGASSISIKEHLHFVMYKIGCKNNEGKIITTDCSVLKTYPYKPEPLAGLYNFPAGEIAYASLYGEKGKLTCTKTCGKIMNKQSFPISINLKAYNGQYVVSEGGGGGVVNANRSNPRQWETFNLIDINGGSLVSGDSVSFRTFNKHYLVAEGGGGREILANKTHASTWGTFIISKISGTGIVNLGDKVSLQASNGQYLVAERGGGSVVNANRSHVRQWETFTIEASRTPIK